MQREFSVDRNDTSHAVYIGNRKFEFSTPGEIAGQLVMCQSGEFELFGHNGEWAIPADHMVFIPPERMFRIRARIPSSGVVVKFCRDEVAWRHNGCWVGPVNDMALQLLSYARKWSDQQARRRRQARCFFVTLGEMLPGWFRHERILWTPYAEHPSVRKAIEFARQQGAKVTLPEVASHVGMSERTLRRYINTELGQNWRDFIRELRMNRAMELLRREHKSITQTAFEVGFSSSSAFSSAFFKYVGKSPSAYARSSRKPGLRSPESGVA